MRILDVSFSNLASLKGSFSIDFTRLDSLFAIIGPTGSGKTTILDAITLALYAQTPRLDISQSSNEIMSKGTGSCSSAVHFESKGRVYKAVFSQKTARSEPGARLQSIERRVYDQDGDDFGLSRATDVNEKIAELAGLSFEQFTKAMLLAQGSFAEFLNMKGSDRSQLLESLTGTEIYSRISQKVFEISREKSQAYSELTGKLELMSLLSEDQRKDLEKGIAEAERSLAENDRTLAGLGARLERYRQKEKARLELERRQKAYDQASLNLKAFEPKAARLEVGRNALALKSLYYAFSKAAKDLENARLQLQKSIEQQASSQKSLDSCKKALEPQREELQKRKALLAWARSIEPSIRALDSDIRDIESAIRAGEKELDGKRGRIGEEAEASKQLRKRLEKAQRDIQAAQAYLSSHESHRELASSQALIAELAAELGSWKSVAGLWDGFAFLDRSIQKLVVFASDMKARMLGFPSSNDWPVKDSFEAWLKRAIELAGRLERCLGDVDLSMKEKRLDGLLRSFSLESADPGYIDNLVKAYADSASGLQYALAAMPGLKEALEESLQHQKKLEEEASASEKALEALRAKASELKAQRAKALGEDLDSFLGRLQRSADEQAELCLSLEEKEGEAARSHEASIALATERQEALSRSQAEEIRCREDLGKGLETSSFASIEDLKASMLDTEAMKALENEKRALEQICHSLEALLGQARENLESLGKEEDPASLEELESQRQQAQSLHDSLIEKKTEIALRLDEDCKAQEAYDRASKELGKAKDAADLWALLSSFIGSADGSKFRKYAQVLNLEALIASANQYLRSMSTRYEVERDRSGDGLGLVVLDAYHGLSPRPADNLSGGESFIISLALALGLSGLLSSGTTVETLFLDEGFGTLDRQSLTQVLDALSSLNQKGRMVGIISHVEDVQSSIACCIQVIAGKDGTSTLSLPL